MNQGKLEVVKQEMNIDTLGISVLKWTGKGKFNSDDHHGQESCPLLLWARIPLEEMEYPS